MVVGRLMVDYLVVVERSVAPSVDCTAPVVSVVRHIAVSSDLDGSEHFVPEPDGREWRLVVDIARLVVDIVHLVADFGVEVLGIVVAVDTVGIVDWVQRLDGSFEGFRLDVELDNETEEKRPY